MLNLDQYTCLGAALRDALGRWPNETCLIESDRDKERTWLTYSDFKETAAQLKKFDHPTAVAAKKFIKPIPYEELKREIDIFCELFARPAVDEGLRKFVESTDAQPYLP